jgi:hypothetical protein
VTHGRIIAARSRNTVPFKRSAISNQYIEYFDFTDILHSVNWTSSTKELRDEHFNHGAGL